MTRTALAGAVLVAGALLGGCGSGDGDRLPDVAIESLQRGTQTSLAEIEGPAVVNLWATWCTPCRTEIPEFEAVHLRRGDEVTMIGINVGESPEQATEFLDEVGATYDQYLDRAGRVSTAMEATTLPVTVVIDAEGKVVARSLGAMDQDALDDAIDDAVGG